jgi:hypothetical protein
MNSINGAYGGTSGCHPETDSINGATRDLIKKLKVNIHVQNPLMDYKIYIYHFDLLLSLWDYQAHILGYTAYQQNKSKREQ